MSSSSQQLCHDASETLHLLSWLGLCTIVSKSCLEPTQSSSGLSFTSYRDGHTCLRIRLSFYSLWFTNSCRYHHRLYKHPTSQPRDCNYFCHSSSMSVYMALSAVVPSAFLAFHRSSIQDLNLMVPLKVCPYSTGWASHGNLTEDMSSVLPPPSVFLTTDTSWQGWDLTMGLSASKANDPQQTGHYTPVTWHSWLYIVHSTLFYQPFGVAMYRCVQTISQVYYINKQGGTVSKTLCKRTLHLWEWWLCHNSHLTAIHVPGVLNTQADTLSWTKVDDHKWLLNKMTAPMLCVVSYLVALSVAGFSSVEVHLAHFCASWPYRQLNCFFPINYPRGLTHRYPPMRPIVPFPSPGKINGEAIWANGYNFSASSLLENCIPSLHHIS